MKKKLILAILAVLTVFSVAACSGNSATTKDQAATNNQLQKYQLAQPIPQADWSQFRETLIKVEEAEIHGTATTSFFMTRTQVPIYSCPSIGMPVPATAQLTNPDQIAWANGSNSQVIAQAESNGVYTGTTSGTFVTCVLPNGSTQIEYWEGDVFTVGGPAHWDSKTQQVVPDGQSTMTVKKSKNG